MSSVLASLRPQGSQISPTSSASSHTTTPTSPHFHHAPHRVLNHPYASSSHSLEPRYQGSSLSLATISSAISHPRAPTPPLYHAPPNQSFSSYLRSWGPDEIATFLGVYKCGHYVGMFQRNDIDGKVLLDLGMAALKEIGVTKVGERVKLLGGIKDLRKRAAAAVPAMERSRVELRLNGGATPPLGESASPSLSPAVEMRSRLITPSERMHGTGMATGAARRLNTARPPPLDLQPHVSSRPLPLAYQGTVARPGTEARAITPRPIPPRPALQSKASSDTTMAPLHTLSRSNSGLFPATSVPAPAPRPNNLNLRAPPPREAGRRSPSPITNDAADFVNRPLPPAPGQQSSAAEYASSITQQRQHTPTYGDPKYGVTRAPSHRQAPSLSVAPSKPISPIRAKFSAARPAVAPHPFAAPRTREDEKKTSLPHPDTSSLGSDKRNQAGGYVFGSGGMITSKSSSSGERPRKAPSDNMPQVPLEDIRRQVVRFLNKEDGTTRTVNVASCVSGVEVLERVLKKFGKWGIGMSTDTESDEDGDRLEVAGWGVYAESNPDPEGESVMRSPADQLAKPLSEASLLGICMSHRDGGAIREEGLILSRHKKREYRKNIQEFFGETPPPPMSPDSPTYYGPRLGVHSPERNGHGRDTLSGLGKKMNRASTVSIMSGLGVPMGDVPPSPTLRSPSSGSFLATKGRKMYNFFGHRPPSELVFTHLPEYFPSAKKSDLEKTFRQSMLRPAARRGSVAPSESKMSFEVPGERRGSASTGSKVSPPRRTRPVSTRTISSPPPAETIPEEAEAVGEAVPRLSVYNDGGESIRASIDGASDASSIASGEIRPPLLPPFEPSKESLSDSLHAYSRNSGSARKRPKSALLGRRGSGGSTKSRVSMLSQLRRNRDRSDNASLLTVDEITAEVENRRASTITFDDSGEEEEEEEEEEIFASAAAEPGPIPHDESEESGEEASEDEEEVEDDEEKESEDGDEHGRAFTSTGCKSSIRSDWSTLILSSCTDHQVDQGCSHWRWIIRLGPPRNGRAFWPFDGGEAG